MPVRRRNDATEAILVITVGFLVIALLTGEAWAARVAVVVGLAGLFSATLRHLIAAGWYKLADVLGQIVPNILLTAVYFLVLFPMAMLARLFSRADNLRLKAPAQTNFREVRGEPDRRSFEKPW